MKINGYKPTGPNTEIVVIPRMAERDTDGKEINKDIVFTVVAVLDQEPFEKLCPAPVPPTIVRKGGESFIDLEDVDYKKKQLQWSRNKTNWTILESLKATEGLEWETVDRLDPETWSNYLNELRDFKLVDAEIARIIEAVWSVNGLDEDKIDAARKRFLASVAVMQKT